MIESTGTDGGIMVGFTGRTSFMPVALAAGLLIACSPSTDVGDVSDLGTLQSALISDQVHDDGVPGFFWLPPMVHHGHALHHGKLVPGLQPVVTVEKLPLGSQAPVAVFTTTSGRHHLDRVTSDDHTRYLVLWDTRHSHLDAAATYRIRVELQGFELGFADVDVVRRLRELRRVDRDQFVPLLDDRVFPIVFRIESDALRCVGVVCAPLDQCHVGKCDPFTGNCTSPAKPDGAACDDGSACTQTDACLAGTCVGASPVVCQALDQCHVAGACDPATGVCSDPPQTDGAPCDDGSACSRLDSCQAGACVGGDVVVCTAQDQCHDAGVCDPTTGACSNPAKPDGTACSDGNYCTSAVAPSGSAVDGCLAGSCAGTAIVCDDGNPCTRDGCDPGAPGIDGVTGCAFVPDPTLPGCTTPPPTATVAVVGLTPAATGFFVNQRVSFSVRLNATADRADYDLEFLLYPMDPTTEATGVPIGTWQIPLVAAGVSEHWVELDIPKTLPPGDWGLAVHEYPAGEAFFPGPDDPELVLTIEGALGLPVLDITAIEVTQAALLVDADATVTDDPALYRDSPFAANLMLVARNYPAAQVPVTAHTTWNGQPVPLKLWDAAQAKWVSSLLLGGLDPDAPTGVYLELALAEADAAVIRSQLGAGPAKTTVVVTVNEDSSVAEATCVVDDPAAPVNCRHSAQGEAMLYAAPPASPVKLARLARTLEAGPKGNTSPLRYEKSWSKRLGNQWAGAGIAFLGYAQLSKDGYEASAQGSVPVTLLSFPEFNFIDATASADAMVETGAHVNITVRVLGLNVYEPVDLEGSSIEKDLGDLVDLPKVQKEKSFEKTVIVYVVPLTFKLGASAEIGLEGTITAAIAIGALEAPDVATVSLSGGPYAKAEGFGEAALGVSFFSAGARVTLTLIDAHLTATATGSLELTKRTDNARPLEITGSLGEKLSYSTSFLNGRVGLTVSYPTLRWCRWWRFWYPCGFTTATKEAVLCSWPGFGYSGDLLDESQRLFTIDLCTPATSCGGQCGVAIDNGCRNEDCGCAAGQTCLGNQCVGSAFPFPGRYYVQLRWGAQYGLWRDETLDGRATPLEVTADHRLFRGGVQINNPIFTDNRVQWSVYEDNDTSGDIVFLDGSSNSYIWTEGPREGVLFEGYFQFPYEGILDYRGVRTCVPTVTCEGQCGPLNDGCATIDCGPCPITGPMSKL